jgi:hypothetical protein
MAKDYFQVMTELSAKRAGLLAEVRTVEQDMRECAVDLVPDEADGPSGEAADPPKKRGRKPKDTRLDEIRAETAHPEPTTPNNDLPETEVKVESTPELTPGARLQISNCDANYLLKRLPIGVVQSLQEITDDLLANTNVLDEMSEAKQQAIILGLLGKLHEAKAVVRTGAGKERRWERTE